MVTGDQPPITKQRNPLRLCGAMSFDTKLSGSAVSRFTFHVSRFFFQVVHYVQQLLFQRFDLLGPIFCARPSTDGMRAFGVPWRPFYPRACRRAVALVGSPPGVPLPPAGACHIFSLLARASSFSDSVNRSGEAETAMRFSLPVFLALAVTCTMPSTS